MKIFKLLAVVVISAGLPLVAQTVGASAGQSATANADTSGTKQATEQVSAQAGDSESGTAAVEMRPVAAELQGKLDSKTAKVGDTVAVKTRIAVKTADGTTLPKGTRLTGHVTDVQSHESADSEARIGILLDRAELKGGPSLAIRSRIQSVEPQIDSMATRSIESEDSIGAPLGASGRSSGGGRASGGGLSNGAAGGVAGAAGNVGAGVSAGSNSVLSAPLPDAALAEHADGGATASAGTSVHAVTGVSGGVLAHGTGIAGVSLAANASATSSGTLFGSRKDFRLDGGTQFVLGVATAASAQ